MIEQTSVRYIKNGASGRWWPAAKTNSQLHAGWGSVSGTTLESGACKDIRSELHDYWERRGKLRNLEQDFNRLKTLLKQPSQHVWITFEDGYLWWCQVENGITLNNEGESNEKGNFWLTCSKPWSNKSVGGNLLSRESLPGTVFRSAGFQATICKPSGEAEILRIIKDETSEELLRARQALTVYQISIEYLIAKLREKDFEQLADLLLTRSGWDRISPVGRQTEGIDIEVQNLVTNETAFVQVKSTATNTTLNGYIQKFSERRQRYDRLIFIVHTQGGEFIIPIGLPIQILDRKKLAEMAIRCGLGEWVAKKVS